MWPVPVILAPPHTLMGLYRLVEAHVRNNYGPVRPEAGEFVFEPFAQWDSHPAGFIAWHRYRIRLQMNDAGAGAPAPDEQPPLEMEILFGLDFNSQLQMTDEIFGIFQSVNLPVNTWPYLRSFMADSLGRMSWPPVTLPAFKAGVGINTTATDNQSSQTKRRRRRVPAETITAE